MADKSNRRAPGHDLGASSPDRIRNVVLVGPAGSGKTTLIETLLAASGAVPRAGSVRDGTTVCDHEESEHVHGRTISLAVAPLLHDGTKLNLVDTPGYADFVGELRAGLRAADCALFVVAANEGVDDGTRALWRECAAVEMPRAVVVTKLDQARADYEGLLRQAQAAFGERVLPLFVPVRRDEEVVGLTGLLSPEVDDALADLRGELIEAVIEESEDETLMERYVGGEVVEEQALVTDLERAVARGSFHPVLPVCSVTGVGCAELLDLAVRAFPSPAEHPSPDVYLPSGAAAAPIACDPAGPLVAEVVKTTSDPYVGRVSLVRVFSGTLVPDQAVHVSGHFTAFFGEVGHDDHDEDERIGALAHPFGKAQAPAAQVVAGDLGAIGRLTRAETGDTLSAVEEPRVLRPWSMPEPLLPIAIVAHSKADEDKLSQALARLAAEDPSLRIDNNAETHQLVLWCMGESHAEVTIERLTDRYGVHVDQVPFVVSLRETFAGPASGLGRHVKQSGGHGQYAVCHLDVEPLPEGGGFEFVDKVVGGAVPRQFIASVEKGVRAQMARGVRLGHPVVDLRVTLTDGKAHSVDSSDMAFQTAGALALREAAAATTITMLEPFDTVSVVVPDELVGPVMSDLSSRRGRMLGTDKVGDDRTQVLAEVPQTELVRYAVDLRSSTHGAGVFTRTFAHFEPMPDEVARMLTARE